MTADTFYESLKEALEYLGVAWGDKALVSVYLLGNSVVYEYCGKTASIVLEQVKASK